MIRWKTSKGRCMLLANTRYWQICRCWNALIVRAGNSKLFLRFKCYTSCLILWLVEITGKSRFTLQLFLKWSDLPTPRAYHFILLYLTTMIFLERAPSRVQGKASPNAATPDSNSSLTAVLSKTARELPDNQSIQTPLQACALAEPGGPWCLTFALGWLENLRHFIQIICWAA